MGRLRFTLTNVILWVVLILSVLLSENFAVFNADPMKGFAVAPGYLLCGVIILFLIFYYVLEHKKNGLKFDVILLPSFIAFALMIILNIFRQDHRTFTNFDNTGTFTVDFTLNDKISSALQVVIWFAIIYALIFVYNRFRTTKESIRWIGKIYVVITLLLSFADFIYEFDVISDIFAGTYTGGGVQFFLGNANVWGLLIFAGIITAIILSFKRFSWYYFSCMLVLISYLTFTTSATAIYVSWFAFFAYILFEIFSMFKRDRRLAIRSLIILSSIVSTMVLMMAIFVLCKVPMFVNFWSFVTNSIINKDYFSLTGRTHLWHRIFDLLAANPLDLIFGLGHITGTTILKNYVNFTLKSAHNGFFEVLLRFGIVGLVLYFAFFGLIIFALIKHIKKKNYRFAYIYGLGFLAIILHSFAESSTIFTPNIGGLYFGFIFVLPILNILQEKRFNILKEDTLSIKVENNKNFREIFNISTFVLIISLVAGKMMHIIFDFDVFCSFLSTIFVFFSVFFVLMLVNYKPLNNFNDFIIRKYQERITNEK